ncbi:MAG: hypothetical protein AAGD13_07260 [Pseudomonadota bacterium]
MSDPYWYRAFGMLIGSELDLPEYYPAEPGQPDVTIELGQAPLDIRLGLEAEGREFKGFVLLEDGRSFLHVERVGDFLIEDGREIVMAPLQDVEPGFLRLYLTGSAMGMLFYQRGQFVLHGAAVQQPSGISVVVGPSGAGKSTLAAHLAQSGYFILTDDTLPLTETPGGFLGWPGARLFKLWEDTLTNLDEASGALEMISNRYGKYYVPNRSVPPHESSALREIIVLDIGDEISIEQLSGIDALKTVSDNMYRRELIPHLGLDAHYFRMLSRLCAETEVCRLTRPMDRAAIPETIRALEARWQSAGS